MPHLALQRAPAPLAPAPRSTVSANSPHPDAYERERLFFVRSTGLLDSKADESFDRVTRLAQRLFKVPIALISIVDEHRQWFKSCVGLDAQETARDESFCTHTIEAATPLVIEDARRDPRFFDNPYVVGDPKIRFYAGVPLILPSGHALGSLCIIDQRPRTLSSEQLQLLKDLAALLMSQIDLHQMAGRVNEVTRLPNRGQLQEDLEVQCQLAPGQERTLALVDVMSNEQMQSAVRAVGILPLEVALRSIAAHLVRELPSAATLYHVSETRFAIVLPSAPVAAQSSWIDTLLAQLEEPFSSGGISVQLQVRAGMARLRMREAEVADVLRRATTALHLADAEQRPYAWYAIDFDAPQRRSYGLVRNIPSGLAMGQFRLVYQPKLNLHTSKFSGVEALARWNHPRHGNVPPSEFIALMEKTTLIHDFTEWILHTSLAQLMAWRSQGIEVTMAVNVSSRNLEHPRFLQVLRNACALHQIHPQSLHIEVTENAVIAGTKTAATLTEIQAMGIGVSLDDFGVGYSNLACLHSLPVQLLKLDQSLIKPIGTDQRALKLVRSLIQLGHTLGYRLLAEGVETQEVFDILKREGCDALQGYFLSRPMEAEAIPEFLRSRVCGV